MAYGDRPDLSDGEALPPKTRQTRRVRIPHRRLPLYGTAERKKAAGKAVGEDLTGYAGKKAYFHQPEKECADRPVTGSYRRPAYGAVIGAFLHQRKGYVPVRLPQGPVYH